MRTHHRWLNLLIAVGFALGQWCAVVHASQHEIVLHAEKTPCAICAIAHAAAAKPAALMLPPARCSHERLSVAAPVRLPFTRRAFRPPSRAPPLPLV